MEKLKPCPFCGSEAIYETYSQEYAYGTKNPEIFCNSCKAIFAIEDDSPYMNCEEDYAYRKKKTAEAWNKRHETSYDLSGYSAKLWKAAYERGKAEAQPEPRWIPVTERLPEANEYERKVRKYYLVQNVHGDMMVAAYRSNTTGKTWWEQMYAYNPVEDEIVAWMPLPEPWKGEKE